ncbi:MAG: JDVT-CTERM system CAAX-type protease [Granulosicoccus sp.]|nr:JDVT-CTERM system CAAX-type protease [Granulosicoccus sp.]
MRQRGFWTDPEFWLALAAAPVCWYLMLHLGVSRRAGPLSPELLLIAVIVSPVLEEILFRGGLQSWLLKKSPMNTGFAGVSLANLLTSTVFAALHLLRQPPLWAALVMVPSLVFGRALERHRTLVSPMILHVSYNSGFIWLFG